MGYIDINQNILIPFEYENLSSFSSPGEVASAKENGLFGAINRTGNVVIPYRYKFYIGFQKDGVAKVWRDGKTGFINESGNEIIPVIYDDAISTSPGKLVALKKDSLWAFFNRDGEQKTGFRYHQVIVSRRYYYDHDIFENGLVLVKRNDSIAFLNEKAQETVPMGSYDYAEPFNKNRLAIVAKDKKFGVINESGKIVLPCNFDSVYHPKRYEYDFPLDLFFVSKNNYFQILDKDLNPITENNLVSYEYEFRRKFLQITDINNKMLLMSYNGEILAPYGYEYIDPYQDLFIIKKNGKFSIIDKDESLLLPLEYDSIQPIGDLYIIKKENKFSVINNKAELQLPLIYDYIQPCYDSYIIKKEDKFGIVNKENNLLLPLQYDTIYHFEREDEGIVIQKNKLKGMIDENCKIIIPVEYDDFYKTHYSSLSADTLMVRKNKLLGTIDYNNNVIIPPIYNGLSTWVEYGPKNFHYAKKDGKYGLLAHNGKIHIPVEYDYISCYSDQNLVKIIKNRKYGVVTKNNEVVIPCIYDWLLSDLNWSNSFYNKKEEKFAACLDNTWTYFDKKGNTIKENVPAEEVEKDFEVKLSKLNNDWMNSWLKDLDYHLMEIIEKE